MTLMEEKLLAAGINREKLPKQSRRERRAQEARRRIDEATTKLASQSEGDVLAETAREAMDALRGVKK